MYDNVNLLFSAQIVKNVFPVYTTRVTADTDWPYWEAFTRQLHQDILNITLSTYVH